MYYPEISPTAPATRDDIARAMMLQQQQQGPIGQQGSGEIDPIFAGQLNYQGHSPTASDMAVAGGPFGGRGGGQEGFGEGVADPALGSPTGSTPDPGATPVSGFGRGGDTTSQASQAQQAADRAAITEAVTNQGMIPEGNPLADAAQAFGGNFGRSFTGFNAPATTSTTTSPVAAPASPGWAPDFNDTFSQASRASPTFGGVILGPQTAIPGVPNFAPYTQPDEAVTPGSGAHDNSDVIGSIMGNVIGSVADLNAMGGGGRGAAPSGAAPSGAAPSGAAPSGAGGGGFDAAGTIGSIMGGVTGSLADLGAMSGQGFSSTGGYEGSASMANTGGAQGFSSMAPGFEGGMGAGPGGTAGGGGAGEGGGAVGGFGGGTSGAGSAPGGGTDPGGSPGGVG